MPHTRRTRARRWVLNHLPDWLVEHGFEIFTGILCLTAGIPLLLLNQVGAQSVEATLPHAAVVVWSLALVLGPLALLTGLIGRYRTTWPEREDWIRIEAWGLTALAYVGYIYCLAILGFSGFHAAPAVALIMVFSLTCHLEEIVLQVEIADYKVGLEELREPHGC